MEIQERQVGDVTILDLKGKMTLGEGDEMLKSRIDALMAQGQLKLLINQEEQPYIDSAGLGEIVRSYSNLIRRGGVLKLLNVNGSVRSLLEITKLLDSFEVFTDEAEALRSFAP